MEQLIKFRLKWNDRYSKWVLQTPPRTSSAWNTVSFGYGNAACRWKWPLKLLAWFIAEKERRQIKRTPKRRTEEFRI